MVSTGTVGDAGACVRRSWELAAEGGCGGFLSWVTGGGWRCLGRAKVMRQYSWWAALWPFKQP